MGGPKEKWGAQKKNFPALRAGNGPPPLSICFLRPCDTSAKKYRRSVVTNCSNRESMAYTQGCEVGVPGVWVLAQSRSRGRHGSLLIFWRFTNRIIIIIIIIKEYDSKNHASQFGWACHWRCRSLAITQPSNLDLSLIHISEPTRPY